MGGRRRNTSGPRTMLAIHHDDHFDAFNLLGIPRDDSANEQSYGELLKSSSSVPDVTTVVHNQHDEDDSDAECRSVAVSVRNSY